MNLRDNLRRLLHRVYARRVEGRLDHDQVPKHIGVILDGNRRWAKAAGGTTEQGHQAGADKIEELLGWCAETDVEVVTLWLLSTDNLDRPEEELVPLLGIIENAVRGLAADGRWRVHHVGNAGPAARPHPDRPQGGRAGHGRTTGYSSTSPSATAAGRRSPTRSARCCWTHAEQAAPPSRSSPRSSTSTSSPSTSTPAASPTRTW